MELSFLQANLLIFFTQVGFAGLNTAQFYATVALGNTEIFFQFMKTFFGSLLFIIWTLFVDGPNSIGKQLSMAVREDLKSFVACSMFLATAEIGIIYSIEWMGVNIFSLGFACLGPVSYVICWTLGMERFILEKALGTVIAVGAVIWAVQATWISGLKIKIFQGGICIVVTVFTFCGYYILQKPLYKKYTVSFVTTASLLTACSFMGIVCLINTQLKEVHLDWDDTRMWLCLVYSFFIGQFFLYLTSNASNRVLSASMVCLYSGVQPVVNPWIDLIRTCYFPDIEHTCDIPDYQIIVAGVIVVIGLFIYSMGEKKVLSANKEDDEESISNGHVGSHRSGDDINKGSGGYIHHSYDEKLLPERM